MVEKRKRPVSVTLHKDTKSIGKDVALRTVRPRPLHYEDKLRVLWPGDELDKVDGGSFAKWLRESEAVREGNKQSAEGTCQPQLFVVGNHADPHGKKKTESRLQPIIMGTSSMLAERLGGRTIAVPTFRVLPDHEWPKEPESGEADEQPGPGEETAYFRHRELEEEELEERVEYDADSEDERWLAKRNKQGGSEQLTEDDLEKLIDGFEKAKHAELERQQAAFDRNGGPSSCKSPEEQGPAEIYPASRAIEEFGESFSSLAIRAVHNHWAKKAAANALPLLQRFWYDKPWARLLARSNRAQAGSESDSDDGIPFQGKDTPRQNAVRGRAMDADEVEDRLHAARHDLELLRTIADRVRRREKFKKRQLLEWRTEWQQRLLLARQRKSKGSKSASKASLAKGTPVKAGKPATGRPKVAPPQKRLLPLGIAKKTTAQGLAPQGKLVAATAGNKLTTGKKASLKPAQNGKSGVVTGRGFVSVVVDQLKRLGSWGNRGEAGGGEPLDHGIEASNGLGVGPEEPASRASQVQPPATMTRQQEQEIVEAAIKLSLEEQKAPARGHGQKHVRFAGALPRARPSGGQCPEAFSAVIHTPLGNRRRVLWSASCSHGQFEFGNAIKLRSFLERHADCRPAWRQLKQRPGESEESHKERLKSLVPFSIPDLSESEGSEGEGELPSPAKARARKSAPHGKAAAAPGSMKPPRKRAGPVTIATGKARPAAAQKPAKRARTAAHGQGGPKPGREAEGVSRRKGPTTRDPSARGTTVEEPEGSHEPELGGRSPSAPASSSSGSDTCVAASSGHDSDGLDQPLVGQGPSCSGGARLTRRTGALAAAQLRLPDVPLEWRGRSGGGDAASDASSFSEGSGPSFFGQRGDETEGPKRQAGVFGRTRAQQRGPAKKGQLVAAARRAAKRASQRE